MTEARATSVVDIPARQVSGSRLAWTTAAVLMLAGTLSWIDRSLPNVLIEPMRTELRIDDTAVALMNGTAFALCYGAISLPLGYAADRTHRVRIIAAGVLIWSLLTLAVAWATGFWTLFICRMGVGLGEAALAPAAYSLLANRFSAADLPRGLALLTLGAPLGSAAGWAGGGTLYQHFAASAAAGVHMPGDLSAWRLTFASVGVAGVIVAVLVAMLPEPTRLRVEAARSADGRSVPLWPHLVAQRGFLVPFLIGVAGFNIFSGGYLGWIAPFFQRTYGWTTGGVGVAVGMAVLGCGISGAVAGGWLTSRLTRRSGQDAVMKVSLGCAIVVAPFAVLSPLAPVDHVAFAGLVVMLFVLFGCSAIVPAAVLNIAPPTLHARAGAIALLVGAVLGTGFGPTLFALVTDHVFQDPAKLRYSLSAVSAVSFTIVIVAFVVAERRYAAAVAHVSGTS